MVSAEPRIGLRLATRRGNGHDRPMSNVQIGMTPPWDLWRRSIPERREAATRMADAGIDHFFLADHVSFHDGSGTDALLAMAGLAQLEERLSVMAGVYLLALRHPVVVARQLATLSELAEGRIVFGVGVGGEDRHEIEVCGVDPATRGRRTDECLEILRPLLRGETVTHHGEFVSVDDAVIRPTPPVDIPFVVGGRSNAALRRAGRYAEGWLGTWCSTRRFAEATEIVAATAAEAGREPAWTHGLQVWVGVGKTKEAGAANARRRMEAFYKIPFEAFEKYVPVGTPEDIAADLAGYRDVGSTIFNITPCGDSAEDDLEAVSAVAELLRAEPASSLEPPLSDSSRGGTRTTR